MTLQLSVQSHWLLLTLCIPRRALTTTSCILGRLWTKFLNRRLSFLSMDPVRAVKQRLSALLILNTWESCCRSWVQLLLNVRQRMAFRRILHLYSGSFTVIRQVSRFTKKDPFIPGVFIKRQALSHSRLPMTGSWGGHIALHSLATDIAPSLKPPDPPVVRRPTRPLEPATTPASAPRDDRIVLVLIDVFGMAAPSPLATCTFFQACLMLDPLPVGLLVSLVESFYLWLVVVTFDRLVLLGSVGSRRFPGRSLWRLFG